jgi:putative ABC transport system permease protein
MAAGVWLSSESPTDAVVPASWASANGVALGDSLLISGRRPGVPPMRIVGLLADTGLGAVERGEVLIAGRETLDQAFEAPSPLRYIDLDLGDEASAFTANRVTAGLTEPYVVETAADAALQLASAQADFAAVALLIGLVSLAVGSFLVGTTLAMTVGERTRELGLLRAAGTTSRQVVGIVVRQALVIGVAGSAIGILAGVALAAGMIWLLAQTRAVLVLGLPLPIGGLLAAFALGVVVTLIGAVIPARRAALLVPLDALQPSRRPDRGLLERLRPLIMAELAVVGAGVVGLGLGTVGTPVVPLVLSLGLLVGGAMAAAFVLEPLGRLLGRPFEWLFGAQGLLGRLNLSRDRTRTGLSVGAMMIALAAVVVLGTIAESARAGTERWVASVLPGGHAIRASVPLEVETFRPALESTAGLQTASPVLELPVVRVTDFGQEEAAIAGIDPNVFQDADALLITGASRTEAFEALRGGGTALVPVGLARRAGIEVGDVIGLRRLGGPVGNLVVAGLVEYSLPARTDEGAILVGSADARDLFGATSAALWIMIRQPDIPEDAFAGSVRETAVQLAAQPLTAPDFAGDLSRSLDRMLGLFDVLALIAVAIGALGIVNTLAVGIGERVREISILRSHGMTVGQVQAMVVSEAALMGAVAGVLAVAIGLLVAVALISGGVSDELVAGVRLPWPLLGAVVLLGTGVAALAGLYPARVAASMPIVGNLKHFE